MFYDVLLFYYVALNRIQLIVGIIKTFVWENSCVESLL